MSILLLTGPPASGKNTIAQHLAKQLDRCAVIDSDEVRQMVIQPNKLPWEGDEGHKQQLLGIDNTCGLANKFHDNNFNVVLTDAVTDATLSRYKDALSVELFTVLILPTQEEVARRLLSRPDYLSRGQAEVLYTQQASFGGYDEVLDNTELSIAEATDWVLERWPGK